MKAYSTVHKNHDSDVCPIGNRVYYKTDAAYAAIESRSNFVVCSIEIEHGDTSLDLRKGALVLTKDVRIIKIIKD